MAYLITRIGFTVACLVSGELLANESVEKVVDLSKGFTAGYFLKLGTALLLVLAVFYAFAWFMRRMHHMPAGEAGLQIVGGLNVGSKEKLIVVQIGEEQVLVGVTQQSINRLHVLKEPISVAGSGVIGKPVFAKILDNVLKRGTLS